MQRRPLRREEENTAESPPNFRRGSRGGRSPPARPDESGHPRPLRRERGKGEGAAGFSGQQTTKRGLVPSRQAPVCAPRYAKSLSSIKIEGRALGAQDGPEGHRRVDGFDLKGYLRTTRSQDEWPSSD